MPLCAQGREGGAIYVQGGTGTKFDVTGSSFMGTSAKVCTCVRACTLTLTSDAGVNPGGL